MDSQQKNGYFSTLHLHLSTVFNGVLKSSPVSRCRLAQFLALNGSTNCPFTPTNVSQNWNITVMLVISHLVAGVWLILRSYRRRSCSRLSSEAECVCDTPKVLPEKGNASSLSGKKGEQMITFSPKAVEREQVRRRSGLVALMLSALFFIVWSWSRPTSGLQEVFQVYQPVDTSDNNDAICSKETLLVDHVFGFSYGHPFVGYYEPPNCDFDTVQLNLTVTSRGRQYDRLAHMYLGDVEVFRTSTAEPTADGIEWTYIKDMSQYYVLWKEPQKVIFDLGNLVNDVYTGSFTVRVTVRFSKKKNVQTPRIVLPISAQNSARNSSSAFIVPAQEAKVTHIIDPRASRAVASISACGQSLEEFWYLSVFSSDTGAFNHTVDELTGYSPFREIQLYIDGILAGVVWPFPVIFTGGASPGLWRPIVGIDAFDLRSPEIDISPFLPLITDGASHSFEIKVVGLDVSDTGAVMLSEAINSYWVISGNIFVYLDDDANRPSPHNTTIGQLPQVLSPAPTFKIDRNLVQTPEELNESLSYSVRAERILTIKSNDFLWSQNFSFSIHGSINQYGRSQEVQQQTSGAILSGPLNDGNGLNELSFEYPLTLNTTYSYPDDKLMIDAWIQRGLTITTPSGLSGISTYTLTSGPVHIQASQWGQSTWRAGAGGGNSTSRGDTSTYFESDAGGSFYQRFVRAVNGGVVSDSDSFFGEILKAPRALISQC